MFPAWITHGLGTRWHRPHLPGPAAMILKTSYLSLDFGKCTGWCWLSPQWDLESPWKLTNLSISLCGDYVYMRLGCGWPILNTGSAILWLRVLDCTKRWMAEPTAFNIVCFLTTDVAVTSHPKFCCYALSAMLGSAVELWAKIKPSFYKLLLLSVLSQQWTTTNN